MFTGVVLRALCERIEAGQALVGGVLSGTSADGIDVVLARLARQASPGGPGGAGGRLRLSEVVAFEVAPFPGPLAERVRTVLDGAGAADGARTGSGAAGAAMDLRDLALLDRDLGRAFGRAAADLALDKGLELDLLGSHGQTVWHHDDREAEGPATLQLGDGDFVAEAAGCCVVSDFRQRDVAAGGGGAPLSAYADDLLFPDEPRPLTVLNLGGLANLSWLDGERVLAFDTGPAGSLLDGLARRLLDRPFDEAGRAAAEGRVDRELVTEFAAHPFCRAAPPKSTGRDTFGERYVEEFLRRGEGRQAADLLASGVALVTEMVALGMGHLPTRPRSLLVAGGGVHNLALLEALRRRLDLPVAPSCEAGVDPDAREALVFAALAARCLVGEPVTSPYATGAAPGRVLGKISPPNPGSKLPPGR